MALLLCPTRELSQQVYIETKRYARIFGVRVAALLGGENKHEQWKELRAGIEIIVATPGRLIDLYKKKATNFKRVSFVTIDEADKMFSLGFEPQMRAILSQVRPERQILLFSATYKRSVRDLSLDYLRSPVQIVIGKENQANLDIKQEVVVFEKLEEKMDWLLKNIPEMLPHGKVLIFVNHIKSCNFVDNLFQEFLPIIPRVVLHGSKLQHERTLIIRKFKKEIDLMIATDVASRGLDIPQIKFVVNYENPKEEEVYVHRIGRTGRAGDKEGTAVTLIMKKEKRFAGVLARKFTTAGLAVPSDLKQLALKDEDYAQFEKKVNMGFEADSEASKKLNAALAAGQKGKKGIGFKKKDSKGKSKKELKKENMEKMLDKMYGDSKVDLIQEYKQMVAKLETENFKIEERELYGRDKVLIIFIRILI